MIFKIINKDKVKILVERNELVIIDDIKNFSVGDTVPRSVEEFLCIVNKKTGIDFTNSKIIIEVVGCNSQSYYIIITRISSESKSSNDNEVDMYIFKVPAAEMLFNAVDIFLTKHVKKIKNELYEYKGILYFCVYINRNDYTLYDELIPQLECILEKCRWNIINDSILKEWGELLSDDLIKEITATEC